MAKNWRQRITGTAMKPILFVGFVVFLIASSSYSACAESRSFEEADVGSKGSFSLSYSHGGGKATASIFVASPKVKDPTKPIGNFNSLTKLSIVLDGRNLPIPASCSRKLLDVNYIRLEHVGPAFRFWVQGGDASEAYQVAFSFARTQAVTCKFLPDGNDVSIDAMLSKKTIESISRGGKK